MGAILSDFYLGCKNGCWMTLYIAFCGCIFGLFLLDNDVENVISYIWTHNITFRLKTLKIYLLYPIFYKFDSLHYLIWNTILRFPFQKRDFNNKIIYWLTFWNSQMLFLNWSRLPLQVVQHKSCTFKNKIVRLQHCLQTATLKVKAIVMILRHIFVLASKHLLLLRGV